MSEDLSTKIDQLYQMINALTDRVSALEQQVVKLWHGGGEPIPVSGPVPGGST